MSTNAEPEAGEPTAAEPEVGRTFEKAVDAGARRLDRSLGSVLATGVVGGLDVAVGVLALLVVEHQTGSILLGALAFSIGFVALTLANSELFTENFLVPIAAVVADHEQGPAKLARLWSGTLIANWVAGCSLGALIVVALPDLEGTAVKVGSHYPEVGIGLTAFASAVLAGFLITLMTWMERGTDSVGAKLLAAIVTAFLLAGAPLHHTVVILIEMAAGLMGEAPYGSLDALGAASYAVVGNMVGGLGLVTLLRFAQVGRAKVAEERERSATEPDRDGD